MRPVGIPAGTARLNLAVMGCAFTILGASMLLQPHRWAATPAYHVLLQIFLARVWGTMFLTAGAGMLTGTTRRAPRWLLIAVLTFAFMLTTGWALAFMVRWATSSSTTPETWVSWAVFDYLLLRAAASLDLPRGSPYAPGVPPPGQDMP